MFLAPAGTMAFNQHGCPVFMLIFKFACKWAVSKKLATGFAQIFVCEIKIYLFGSYLRFKSRYKFLGIKLYDLPLNLQNTPLKFKIRVLDYHTQFSVLARHLFRCVSAPLENEK